ncbi:MAG: KH domain-containing protein [bacterium]
MQTEVKQMKEFIEFIIKHLVDKPDEVHVNEIDGERTVVFELRVGQGDMGKVIGRRGQTAKSLRTLLAAASAKMGKRAVLEILE